MNQRAKMVRRSVVVYKDYSIERHYGNGLQYEPAYYYIYSPYDHFTGEKYPTLEEAKRRVDQMAAFFEGKW